MGDITEYDQQLLCENIGQRCPDCGTAMLEIDSLHENGVRYVWYECCQQDCSGQRLEKEQL